MKQKLLFLVTLLLTFTAYSQVANQPEDYIVCDYDPDGLTEFNLTRVEPEVLGSQDSSNFTISYYLTLADAESGNNPIANVNNYTNLSNPQIIFVRVEDMSTNDYATTNFDLVVDFVDLEAFVTNNVSCSGGNDGEINLNASGGMAPYHYKINNGAFQISNIFSSLSAGVYDCFVVDSFDCGQYITVMIQEPEPISLSATLTKEILCSGDSSAEITLNASGGVAPYMYSINNISYQTSEVFTMLSSGTYTCSVRDSNGCINSVTLSIEGPVPMASSIEITRTSCAGSDLNEIIVIVTGGTSPYQYSINGFNFQNSNVFSSVPPGNHLFEVVDSRGCILGVFIEIQDTLILNNEVTPLKSCDANNNGVIVFDLDSKTSEILEGLPDATLTFHTSNADAVNNINPITSPYFTPGTVYVRGTDAEGCYRITTLDLIVVSCPVTVNCGMPVNVSFCYTDNDTREYTFKSNNGQPLGIIFNAGQLENNFDALVVLDSDGVTNLNANTPYGNNGDVSNLMFGSSGDTITVSVVSNGSINCEDQAYIPLDFDVFCADGSIYVDAFRDSDNNGIFEEMSESFYTQGYFTYEKNNNGVINTVNSSSGNFRIITSQESDTFDIAFYLYAENETCYDVAIPLYENISVPSGSSKAIQFSVVVENPCNDLALYLLNYFEQPRPGFTYSNYLIIENYGDNTVNSGSIEFINDETINYIGTGNLPTGYTATPTATGFTLDFVNLSPGIQEYVEILLDVPTTLNIGDSVTNTVNYITASNDINANNNASFLTEDIVNSYDPNDIAESYGKEIIYDDFTTTDEYLYYTIRFQNLGTADAVTVRIENTLHELLDQSTIQLLQSSHDVVMTENNSQLTFSHENINLAPQVENEEESKGFVYYKIKPKAGYNVGTEIPNTAEIYFDFNAPVVTNTFVSDFVDNNLSVSNFETNTFSLYPNPVKNKITIKLNKILAGNTLIEIINVQGQLIASKTMDSTLQEKQIDLSNIARGVYFVKLENNSNTLIKKLIIE